MPDDTDDLIRLRSLDESDQIDRVTPPGQSTRGAPSMVARTKTITTYPTAAARFYACSPVVITGAETEGATGTKTVDASATIYAFNLGSAIPATGTDVNITFVKGRWVFRHD